MTRHRDTDEERRIQEEVFAELTRWPFKASAPLWRYMDFAKFAALLSTSALHFSRVDQFDDVFEGSVPEKTVALRRERYTADASIIVDKLPALTRWSRNWAYVNCWHQSDHESAAMWRLYASSNQAIAIQTTFARLRRSLPPKVLIAPVRYIDYSEDEIPEGNVVYPLLYKRKSFEHEREVRAILIADPPELPAGDPRFEMRPTLFLARNDKWFTPDVDAPNPEAFKKVEVVLAELIESVRVAPTSPEWFLNVARHVASQYGFAFSVGESPLDRAPLF